MTPNSDKPKVYKHTRADGTTVHVTVPDDPEPEEVLVDAIRANLSPQAVALIIAKLQPVYAKAEIGARTEREVAWFSDQLLKLLGSEEQDALRQELGL